MKKRLLLMVAALSSCVYAGEYQNNMGDIHARVIRGRGEEQFRTNVIAQDLNIAGQSGSNQYIEFVGLANGKYRDGGKFTRTKDFLLGTNSNLVSNSDVFAGIALGHLKSHMKIDDSSVDVRSYGFDYLIGKRDKDKLIIGKFGYTENKNQFTDYKYRSKTYHIGGELGKIYTHEDFSIYPFVKGDWEQHTVKSHNGVSRFNQYLFSVTPGVNLIKIFGEKVMINGGIEYSLDITQRKYKINNDMDKKLPRHHGEAHIQVGYFWDYDFLVTFDYRKIFNSKYNYDLFSVGLSHNF